MANPEWENYSGPAQVIVTRADLGSLPVFIDGGDGSMWKSRNTLDEASSDSETAARHYVRLSDLLRLFNPVATKETGESPIPSPVVHADECVCGSPLPCYSH